MRHTLPWFVLSLILVLGCGESKEEKEARLKEAEACFYKGGRYMTEDRFIDAIVAYKKAIALKPDSPGAYLRMGLAYENLKQYSEALAAYKKAIELKQDFPAAYYCMGLAYENLKQYSEALAAYKKAIAIKPDYADAYFQMGECYNNLKQLPEAIVAYEKCIALEPKGIFADDARKSLSEIKNKAEIEAKAEAQCNKGKEYFHLRKHPEAIITDCLEP
jgi:tetratricopeptide (TPR) repeat protein